MEIRNLILPKVSSLYMGNSECSMVDKYGSIINNMIIIGRTL